MEGSLSCFQEWLCSVFYIVLVTYFFVGGGVGGDFIMDLICQLENRSIRNTYKRING